MKRRTFFRSTVAAAAATTLPGRDGWAELYHAITQAQGDLEAIRGDGGKVTLKGAVIRELGSSLRGKLLLASTAGYDDARRVLNPTIDRRPALIAQPASTAEVQAAVAFARGHGLLTAVKCGGHSTSGQSTCDGGLMIDLSRLRGVRVDPAAKRAVVAGGSLLGQVDQATQPHGLVTPLGTVSHTGVGGLTTGGGFGRVARRFGLALDNVTAVEVVTADGKLVRANRGENEALFWAVRGGGGNFGIVTSFEFQLHPMQRQVIGGDIVFPFAKARDVLSFYADASVQAPDDLYLDFSLGFPPGGGEGFISLSACYSGPASGAARVFEPIKRLGTPISDQVKPIDYVDLQRSGDVTDPRAMGTYLKSGFTPRITPDLISAIVTGIRGHPARMTMVFDQHCGGAISRVPPASTAFAHREAKQNLLAMVAWKTGADSSDHVSWLRQYWATLEPFTKGWYSNEFNDESALVVDANYRENHARLVTVKNKYDPTNLFRLNANVRPSVKT
jgi:FAD/FMN-containing dehydrogenase